MCVDGSLRNSRSLADAFNGSEQGGLTRFNCPGTLDLRTSWSPTADHLNA